MPGAGTRGVESPWSAIRVSPRLRVSKYIITLAPTGRDLIAPMSFHAPHITRAHLIDACG